MKQMIADRDQAAGKETIEEKEASATE